MKIIVWGCLIAQKTFCNILLLKKSLKNLAYGQHSALSYMCDKGVPILYIKKWSIWSKPDKKQ